MGLYGKMAKMTGARGGIVDMHTAIQTGHVALGGSWDLVSTVISTLTGVMSNSKYSYFIYNPSY